jgi:hypothetical protein
VSIRDIPYLERCEELKLDTLEKRRDYQGLARAHKQKRDSKITGF